jgi:hypothetical protein
VTKELIETTYVDGEGRAHLDDCLASTLDYCQGHGILTLVIYTATGDGVVRAMEMQEADLDYSEIRFVAVTPPMNRPHVVDPHLAKPASEPVPLMVPGIVGERRLQLHTGGVPILSARLPFEPILPGEPLSDPWQLVNRAFGILGGGFSLCVQAVLVACDAGVVRPGERVASMTADTAIVARASHTETFLSPVLGLLVEHIICRPLLYDISKRDHVATQHALNEDRQEELPLLEDGVADE